jgi:hypothetical protein
LLAQELMKRVGLVEAEAKEEAPSTNIQAP